MKPKNSTQFELLGDNHQMSSVETPLRIDAFKKTDDEKISSISLHFKKIMEELGLDLEDDSLKGTPYRFAKMYVKELFSGLNPKNKPSVSTFENKYQYRKMLAEMNITFYSACEHHFLPIVGKAHIAYISSGKVIGISKINRLVQYYAKRPQVQERMTLQIFNDLCKALDTPDVIVVLEAEHLCVSSRGVQDTTSYTSTLEYGGEFKKTKVRNEFYALMKNS